VAQCAEPERNLGSPPCLPGSEAARPLVGNPINPGIGNKYQAEIDIEGFGDSRLGFARHYNSDPVVTGTAIGRHWRHTYDRSVVVDASDSEAAVYRPDGKVQRFRLSGGAWVADPNVVARLEQLADGSGAITGWRYRGADDTVEDFDATGRLERITFRGGRSLSLSYDIAGRLTTVAGDFGRRLSFAYDAGDRIASVSGPTDAAYRYLYDAAGNLVRVVYPDDTPTTTEAVPCSASTPAAPKAPRLPTTPMAR
jgi:YD repeat-containing protein